MRLKLAAGLLFLLTACQTPPVYETRPTYAPPDDRTGRRCVAGCGVQRDICHSQAAEARGQCRVDVYPDLLAEYQDALVAHEAALAQHQLDLARYETDRDTYQAQWSIWQSAFTQCLDWNRARERRQVDRIDRRIDLVRLQVPQNDQDREHQRARLQRLYDDRRDAERDLDDVDRDCRHQHPEPVRPERPVAPIEPTRPGAPESDDPYSICLAGEVTALGRCTEAYNSCYAACGGVVGEEQVCVEHCE